VLNQRVYGFASSFVKIQPVIEHKAMFIWLKAINLNTAKCCVKNEILGIQE